MRNKVQLQALLKKSVTCPNLVYVFHLNLDNNLLCLRPQTKSLSSLWKMKTSAALRRELLYSYTRENGDINYLSFHNFF